MASVDLSEFSRRDFSVTAWVNAACSSKPSDEPLDKVLSELEMRLQLTAEEVDSSLQEASGLVMRRVPAVIQEIYRLQGDIYGMQDSVKGLGAQAERDEAQARRAVAVISQIAQVKRNVESACSTLKEATELSDMFYKVEDVFRSGDLLTVSDMLSTMRRSLDLVGDVPEFKGSKAKLQALQDRLQALVEGSLADGFSSNKDASIQRLSGMLIAVDRYTTVELLYCNSRLVKLQAIWDQYAHSSGGGHSMGGSHASSGPHTSSGPLSSGGSRGPHASGGGHSSSGPHSAGGGYSSGAARSAGEILKWLPAFFAEVTEVLGRELKWCQSVFGERAPGLVASLMMTFFQKLSRPIKERLGQETRLGVLVSLLGSIEGVVRGLRHQVLAQAPLEQQAAVIKLVFEPMEGMISQYGLLEGAQLSGELGELLHQVVGSVDDVEAMVKKVQDSVKGVLASCRVAVERCMSFTGGTELGALMRTLDLALVKYFNELKDRVRVFQARMEAQLGIRGAGSISSSSASPDLSLFQEVSNNLLALVLVSKDVSSGFAGLEALLRTSISHTASSSESCIMQSSQSHPGTGTSQQASNGSQPQGQTSTQQHAPFSTQQQGSNSNQLPPGAAGVISLRLLCSPKVGEQLQLLASFQEDSRFQPLPSAVQSLDSLLSSFNTTVFDTLLGFVTYQLRDFHTMPVWTSPAPPRGAGLPSFHMYPLQYITAIGEYIMTMPPKLEVLMVEGAEDEAESGELAAEWLDKVVSGAATLFVDAVTGLKELSQAGGMQLAVDVEYFCNMMGAMQVQPSLALVTLQLYVGQPPDVFLEQAIAAAAEGSADVRMLRLIADWKKVVLEGV